MEKMKEELKALKTVLGVPRLRNEMVNFDFKNLDFSGFMRTVGDLTTYVKGQLASEKLIKADPVEDDHIRNRQSLMMMNNTFFNMTQTSMVEGSSTPYNLPEELQDQVLDQEFMKHTQNSKIKHDILKRKKEAGNSAFHTSLLGMRSAHLSLANTNSSRHVFGATKHVANEGLPSKEKAGSVFRRGRNSMHDQVKSDYLGLS